MERELERTWQRKEWEWDMGPHLEGRSPQQARGSVRRREQVKQEPDSKNLLGLSWPKRNSSGNH